MKVNALHAASFEEKTGSKTDVAAVFSPHIFWDVDAGTIDPQLHEAFLVQRVLEYGKWEDWLALRKLYTIKRITVTAATLRNLEPKALHFIATIGNKPLSNFRCYISKPSMPAHNRFYSD